MLNYDNAPYRQKHTLRCVMFLKKTQLKLRLWEVGLNYVDLDGTVGCMVNGAD
jgi:succinyl-CoA synthetase beta subunit